GRRNRPERKGRRQRRRRRRGLGAARQRLQPTEHQGRDDDRCEAESFHWAWLHPMSPLNGTSRAADPTWRVIGFHRLIAMKMLIAKAATFRAPFLSPCRARPCCRIDGTAATERMGAL